GRVRVAGLPVHVDDGLALGQVRAGVVERRLGRSVPRAERDQAGGGEHGDRQGEPAAEAGGRNRRHVLPRRSSRGCYGPGSGEGMGRGPQVGVTVTVGEQAYKLEGGEPFTFGRSSDCTVCLDADDSGISRRAGSIERDGGTWWLLNRSSVRALAVVDEL